MDFASILAQYGLPGMIIFVLGTVVVVLWRENKALIKQLFDLQEQRRLEGLETAKELNATLQTFSQSTTMLVDKIKIVKGDK